MKELSTLVISIIWLVTSELVEAFAPFNYCAHRQTPGVCNVDSVTPSSHNRLGFLRQTTTIAAADFETSNLHPNSISSVKWATDGEAVSPWSFRLGLHSKVTKALLEYCNKTGITDTFRELVIDEAPLVPGTNRIVHLGGQRWYIQRPGSRWQSNMHWISPGDEAAHNEYLKVLSDGGFDDVLKSIGEYFGFDGLVAYHVTIIGVSHCSRGYMHHDFEYVKGFNLIIPLILTNDSKPELDLEQRSNRDIVGQYKYKIDEASMVGDRVGHATAACDYRNEGEMRMAATVYIADVNNQNVNRIVDDFTQLYPPRNDCQYLIDRAGSHWKYNDPTKKLPLSLVGFLNK